jgi:TolB-like protein/DNA-binding winged helix-turn-helix (wHTH) protein/Tfp pilus assembly protein PilF
MLYQFADIRLDTDAFSLHKNGDLQAVEPQAFDLIVYLLERREQLVSRQQIFDDLWPGRVVSDATLSNHIRAARAVMGDDGERQAIIKTVRGRGYQFVAEFLPEEHGSEEPSSVTTAYNDQHTAPSKFPTKNLPKALLVIICFLFIGFSLNMLRTAEKASSTQHLVSIAVLPFANRSDLQEDQYFSDGFHDDLLTQISQINSIKTISRTSVMGYRDSTKSVKVIGEELDVTHILEGGLQRAGNQVRINVQLINTDSDEHVWAQTYTRELNAENIFNIQTEIVQLVSEQMQLALVPETASQEKALPTQSMAALEAWFKGKYSEEQGTTENHQKAVEFYQQAIDRDPRFTEAYVRLARNLLWITWREHSPPEEQINKAEPFVNQALALAPNSSNVYLALGDLERKKQNLGTAEQAYKKAIQINPNNVEALTAYANLLAWRLRKEKQALELYRKVRVLDPNNVNAAEQLGGILMLVGQIEESRTLLEDLVRKHPGNALVHHSLGMLYSWGMMRHDLAIMSFRRALALDPSLQQLRWRIAHGYKELGDKDAVIYWLDSYFEKETNEEDATYDWLGVLAAAKGDMPLAYEYYEKVPLRNPSPASMTLYALAKRDQQQGNARAAIKRYANALPQLDDPETEIDSFLFAYASSYAEFLLAAGEDNKAQALLDRAEKFTAEGGSELDWYIINLVLHRVVQGDKQTAIDLLQHYADQGNSFNFNKDHLPFAKYVTIYEALKGEPQFVELYERFEARKQEQRENLLSQSILPLSGADSN